MEKDDTSVAILKTLWRRLGDGHWSISDGRELRLKPKTGSDPAFFTFQNQLELLTNTPGGDVHNVFSSFGPTDFLVKQSILPVVALVQGENAIRCIGTASVISCSGYLMTASHVLLNPAESKYGKVARKGNTLLFGDGLQMGVFIPISPAYGTRGFRFFRFEQCWFWGDWEESPLIHEGDRFHYLTDIAICKISELPNRVAHQPLSLSLNPFQAGEKAYAFGYALMDDIPIETREGQLFISNFVQDIYVSVGEVINVFPENHVTRDVPAPGPCFDFSARIPGKMSGGRGSIDPPDGESPESDSAAIQRCRDNAGSGYRGVAAGIVDCQAALDYSKRVDLRAPQTRNFRLPFRRPGYSRRGAPTSVLSLPRWHDSVGTRKRAEGLRR